MEHVIEKSGIWISRRQDEDSGIDLEAELAKPEVSGQILKIQIKASESPDITARGVKAVIEKKYLRLAESLRVPFVYVEDAHEGHITALNLPTRAKRPST